MAKIITLNTKGQTQPVEINSKNILVIGPNGVGKSYLLKHFLNWEEKNDSIIDLTDNPEYKKMCLNLYITRWWSGGSSTFSANINPTDELKKILSKPINLKSWRNIKNYIEKNECISLSRFFIDINNYVEQEIKNGYKNMEINFKKLFNHMIKNAYEERNKPDYSTIDDFITKLNGLLLNNRKIIFKLTETDNDSIDNKKELLIKDLNGEEKALESLSDGEKRICAIFSFLISAKAGFFVWDEPENYLHPDTQIEMLKLATQLHSESTFIIATHSPFLLREAILNEKNWITLYMQRTESGTELIEVEPNNHEMIKKVFRLFGLNQEFMEFYKLIDKKVVFVEGCTDKKYFQLCQNNNHNFKFVNLQGAGNITKELIMFMKTIGKEERKKWILIYDKDQTFTNFKKEWFLKCLHPINLNKGEAIEALFKDIWSNKKVLDLGEKECWIIKDLEDERVKDCKFRDKINTIIKKHGILTQDEKIKNESFYSKIPSKVSLCDFLIKNHSDKVIEKLKPTINEISESFQMKNRK